MTTLLTDALADQLAEAVSAGVPLETAAIAAGLNSHALHDWLQAASGTWRSGTPVSKTLHSRLISFSERIHRAQAEFEAKQVAGIAKAAEIVNEKTGQQDWRARAWLLNNHPRTRDRYHEVKQVQQEQFGTIVHEMKQVQQIAEADGLPGLQAARAQLLEQHPELAD